MPSRYNRRRRHYRTDTPALPDFMMVAAAVVAILFLLF